MNNASGYHYGEHKGFGHHHAYLLPTLVQILEQNVPPSDQRVFDLGCGNGSVAAYLSERGYHVTGVDPSEEGIWNAKQAYPELRLEQGSADDDLASRFGTFPVVISLEVVEHVYAPRDYARCLFDLVALGGVAVLSTPYHGYLKNLVLALTGKMDQHFTALWDHGHIKFWSMQTLRTLLFEAGFCDVYFRRVGRIPAIAKSMIAVASKPPLVR